ncbi:MAG: diguanylate cyclase (GGDEF)-like protein [Alteromonadaceae bacterium]
MLSIVKGLKATFFSCIVVAGIFYAVLETKFFWQTQLNIIEQALYGLLIITIIFSSQFSRSRLSFLSAVWAFFYLSINHALYWSSWLNSHTTWLFLCGIFVLGFLSLVKDRGVISIHGLGRIIALICCGLSAYMWQIINVWLIEYLKVEQLSTGFEAKLIIELPMLIIGLLLVWRSISTSSLLVIALLISYLVWCLEYYQWLVLPWSIILTVLVSYYLLVVVIDAYFLAYRDELTALPSRRALNQLSLSLGRKYTVAMLDIDHFKKFNDTYGHDIGDQVLKLVASKLAQVKNGGKVFRYGGEEFTVVFSRKDKEQTLNELERLRQSIADYKIVIRHPQRATKQARDSKKNNDLKTVSVNISIGVADRQNKQNFTQTLKIADQALYRAKKNGRNNVSI